MFDETRIIESRDVHALMEALTNWYLRPDAKEMLRMAREAGWMRGAAIIAAATGGDAWMEFVEDMRREP